MNVGRMALGFAPWLLFSVMTHRMGENSVALAAVVSALLAAALAFYGRGRGGVKVLDAAAVITYAFVAAVALASGPSTDDWLSNFARGGSTLILAAVMLVSAVTVPFTEQYARETVDPKYWRSSQFRARNRTISAFWGVMVLLMGIGHIFAGVLDPMTDPADGTRPIDLLLNWVLPILLVVVAVRYTKHISAQARAVDREDATGPR